MIYHIILQIIRHWHGNNIYYMPNFYDLFVIIENHEEEIKYIINSIEMRKTQNAILGNNSLDYILIAADRAEDARDDKLAESLRTMHRLKKFPIENIWYTFNHEVNEILKNNLDIEKTPLYEVVSSKIFENLQGNKPGGFIHGYRIAEYNTREDAILDLARVLGEIKITSMEDATFN